VCWSRGTPSRDFDGVRARDERGNNVLAISGGNTSDRYIIFEYYPRKIPSSACGLLISVVVSIPSRPPETVRRSHVQQHEQSTAADHAVLGADGQHHVPVELHRGREQRRFRRRQWVHIPIGTIFFNPQSRRHGDYYTPTYSVNCDTSSINTYLTNTCLMQMCNLHVSSNNCRRSWANRIPLDI